MSASGVREKLATVTGIIEIARDYLSIDLSEEVARDFVTTLPQGGGDSHNWMQNRCAVSAGPVIYLKNMILRAGVLATIPPDEPDDVPIMYVKRGHKLIAQVCEVARSKMFRTMLIVYPIDLTAARVTVMAEQRRGKLTEWEQ